MRSFPTALAALALAAANLLLPVAGAQAPSASDYPSRPIRFIVPFPPGSGTDTSARFYAKKVSEVTGQPVTVENRPGGNGFIGVQAALGAPADGYTVFIGSNSTLAVNVALFRKLPYDPIGDFAPLCVLMRAPAVLITPPSGTYRSVAELVGAAKRSPGKVSFGAGSAGYQLMAELFNETAGVDTLHVPYKGASEAVTAIASGQTDFAFAEITSTLELARSGRVRALAVAAEKRVATLPEVPTAMEAGLTGYTAYAWVAAAINSRTPKPVIERLAEIFTRISASPDTREYFARLGAEPLPGGPEEMRRFQNAEIALWKRIAERAKVEQQ